MSLRGLHELLALHHALGVVCLRRRLEVALEHRARGLFGLQQERVGAVAAVQQHHPHAHPDAADAHHLARHARVGVAVEQGPPVGRQARAVAAEHAPQVALRVLAILAGQQVVGGDEQRRLVQEADPAVTGLRELAERPDARVQTRLLQAALELPRSFDVDARGEQARDRVHVEARVPHLEVALSGERAHRLAVGGRRLTDGVRDLLGGELAVATGDAHARREPLDVPLPRSRERLVEVVDVEEELAFGRGERAEVRQVRVSAQLHAQARGRRRGEVGGHDRCRPPVEGERRDEHAPIAQREELGDRALRLLDEHPDRIRTVRRRLPVAVAGSGRTLAQRLSGRGTLVGRRRIACARRRLRCH
ncbi:MAG TPA: hypothetical protein VGF63_10890 [Solirubrobacteraceae bacterium]